MAKSLAGSDIAEAVYDLEPPIYARTHTVRFFNVGADVVDDLNGAEVHVKVFNLETQALTGQTCYGDVVDGARMRHLMCQSGSVAATNEGAIHHITAIRT